ncbi:PKD domain-containing protein [Paraglaciecola aquimarina]|uniref:PKD domain-containing protein n=1 Tax=Paraglaciecola aquimarina TaxID=1235557 RepID=A0ABU3STF3_9ALTE|nr:PKD domain-containing protein [Paraglaciecola aquimarina]MDU0353291.1 PKD domain-containing protein [Paraglaciecola aquimarina]
MAGPIFHANDFVQTARTFPAYFENKLFIYEWMRDWFFVVTLDTNQQYVRAEQFMPQSQFSHPMDMIFASDGNMYLLEYGQQWKKQNQDARLNRISYVSGNRKPNAKLTADKVAGSAPLVVNLSAAGSVDYDGDTLEYQWAINGEPVANNQELGTFTFDENGEYIVELTVVDSAGQKDSSSLTIIVGNDAPEISITITPDSYKYSDNGVVSYTIEVFDEQDGTSENGSISAGDISVTFEYLSATALAETSAVGHQVSSKPKGQELTDKSDCRACHDIIRTVNGPSYQAIAAKYDETDVRFLVAKIINGGAGVWGDSAMSAHPQLPPEEVAAMVNYILSLDPNNIENKGLPLKGNVRFEKHLGQQKDGQYILRASYQDKGLTNSAIDTDSSRLTISEQIIFTANGKSE